jgi:hypothetical protein
MDTGQEVLGYCFRDNKGRVLFEGEDYGCSPMNSIDGDDCIRGIIGFLCVRPGDTDREFFKDYTKDQLQWAEANGEELSLWAESDHEEDFPIVSMPDDRYFLL